jgi:ABC-type multidrug transport system fused ATPase/permease subunit
VLHRGRVVEEGAHDRLLREGGLYATLYEHQFGADGTSRLRPGAV